jgi:hypothetical protein
MIYNEPSLSNSISTSTTAYERKTEKPSQKLKEEMTRLDARGREGVCRRAMGPLWLSVLVEEQLDETAGVFAVGQCESTI